MIELLKSHYLRRKIKEKRGGLYVHVYAGFEPAAPMFQRFRKVLPVVMIDLFYIYI